MVNTYTFRVLMSFCVPWLYLAVGTLSHARPKDSISIAFDDSIRTFDPRQSVDANSQYIEDLIHCSLVGFDADGLPQAQAAQKLPAWSTPTSLVIVLKEGLRFSNGDSVSAKDVVATYKSLLDGKGFARSSAFSNVKDIAAVDADGIRFELHKPDAAFLSNLVVGILPATLASQASIPSENMIGCGPYKLGKIAVTELNLEVNPYSILVPKLKRIHIKTVKNEKTRFYKLQAGEIDISQNGINRDTLKTLEKRTPHLKVIRRPALKTSYLGFNMRDPLTGNPAIREAISLAINRKDIIEILLGGLAVPAATLLPESSPFYNKDLPLVVFDPAKAQAILDKAGFPRKGDFRFELTYKTTTDITRISIAKAIASQLKKVGIKVIVEPMEWGRFKMDIDRGRVQLWSLTWIGFKDPDIYRYAFATESFPPNGGNRGWYSNPSLDKLLEQGRSVTALDERAKIYHEIQRIVASELPYVFLWHEDNYAVVSRQLEDFSLYADGRYSSLVQAFFR